MGQIKPFNQFILQESEANLDPDDDLNQLRDLGLADKEPFDNRLDKMIDEWGGDPEVNAAIRVLKNKTNQYMDKWIDLDNLEDLAEWDRYTESLSDISGNDLGWIEFIIVADVL